jgi:tRNA-Thr(GGU) m(6)t(6)A37 methyltransferase TsaA
LKFDEHQRPKKERELDQEEARPAPIVLKPIATVKNEIKEMGKRCWKEIVSEIVFNPGFEGAMDGLDDFSHIIVLFWMHRSHAWESSMSKTHPQGRPDLPLVGVFATRSPVRPNPLGVAVVKLLERRGNVLRVVGLDAIDGTPVVDIKAYFPSDAAAQATVPDWVHKLHHLDTK